MWHTLPAALFFFAVLAFFFALETPEERRPPAPALLAPAPALEAAPLTPGGTVLPLAMTRGTPMLINFFASWCVPCVEEYPLIRQLGAREDVLLYGIGWSDSTENIRAFLEKRGNPYDQVALDTHGRTAIAYGITGVPETYLLDPAHRIVYHHRGPLTAEMIEDDILPLLKTYEK